VCPGAPAEPEAYQRGSKIQPRRTPPRQHLGTSSQLRYRSGEGALRWSCLLCPGPLVAAAPQSASPKPFGSQGPPALSRKVPLLVMPLVVRRAGTLEAVAHSEVPADRRVDDWCSCVRCGGYEPSII
jgi:hypothetical protein